MSTGETKAKTLSMPSPPVPSTSLAANLGDSADLWARQALHPNWDEAEWSCCPVTRLMKTAATPLPSGGLRASKFPTTSHSGSCTGGGVAGRGSGSSGSAGPISERCQGQQWS